MTKGIGKAVKKSFALFMSLVMVTQFQLPGTTVHAEESEPDYKTMYQEEGYNYVWGDEFDGTELNAEDWKLEERAPDRGDSGLQTYGAPENVEVSDGSLKIYPKAEANEVPTGEANPVVMRNEGISKETHWSAKVDPDAGGVGAFDLKGRTVTIEDAGTKNYAIQLQREGLSLKKGHDYCLIFDATSTADRAVEVSFLTKPDLTWYAGDKQVIGTKKQTFEMDFTVSEDDTDAAVLQLNFGKIEGYEETSVAATVTLGRIFLLDETVAKDYEYKSIMNAKGFESSRWVKNIEEDGAADISLTGDSAVFSVTNAGKETWAVQVIHRRMQMKKDHDYLLTFDYEMPVPKAVQITVMEHWTNDNTGFGEWLTGGSWIFGTDKKTFKHLYTYTGEDIDYAEIQLNFGYNETFPEESATGTFTLSNIHFVDLTEAEYADIGKAYSFTSGRISTQNLHDFTYGRFEARVKVPGGQGYLPAFGLMAADEDTYGQWPLCGDIDIMEVMGQDPTTSYHSLHYGAPDLTEDQESFTLESGSFASTWHDFRVDWEPGSIVWYVDNVKVHEASSWATGRTAGSIMAYPAPFDQDFYLNLGLAIGGSRAGNPSKAVANAMADQKFEVEYVRVYQKDWAYYSELENTVEDPNGPTPDDPEKTIGEDGNYISNGTFDQGTGRLKNWVIDTSGNEAAEIYVTNDLVDGERVRELSAKVVVPEEVTEVDPVIVYQEKLSPLTKGVYKLSFDAYTTDGYADGLKAIVSGKKYKPDMTDLKSFEYYLDIEEDLEREDSYIRFFFYKPGTYYLDNVKLMAVDKPAEEIEISPEDTTPDIFDIRTPIGEAKVTLSADTYDYNGEIQKPTVTGVVLNDETLVEGTDYTVTWQKEDSADAGTYGVTITGAGMFMGTIDAEYTINPRKVTPAIVLSKKEFTYNGKAQKPTVTVKDGTEALGSGDYTVAFPGGCTNAGTYKITVTLKGNYSGTAAANYTIKAKKITPTVTLSKTTFTVGKKAQKPTVTVKDGKTKLAASCYTVKYSNQNSKKVGTYKVTVTLKGNYSGKKEVSYKIVKGKNPLKVKGKKAAVSFNKLKKKKQTLKVTKVLKFAKKGKGTMVYAKAKGNGKISINKKTGLITVKKGLKKGTYTVVLKVKAKGNASYKASKVFKVKVKIVVK